MQDIRHRAWIEDQFLDGHNLLAVAEFLQLAQHGLDLINKNILLSAFQLPKNLFCSELAIEPNAGGEHTDNIVSILVAHQTQERAFSSVIWRRQHMDDLATLGLLAELDTLLNHVARKLVLREHKQLRHHHKDHT